MTSSGPKLFEAASHAKEYLKFRPIYPHAVVERILAFCNRQTFLQSLVVDVGCGSGQSTRYLAPHFKQVVGVDVSSSQLENAKVTTKEENIQYRLGNAESLPCDSSSVDLVTCAQALHWFDSEAFFKEVDRVLKPAGCLVFYGYGIFIPKHKNKEIEKNIYDIYMGIHKGILRSYWDERREHVDNHYINFQSPYADSVRDTTLELKREMTVDGLFGYIKSFSSYQDFIKQNPEKSYIFDDYYKRLLDMVAPFANSSGPSEFKFDFTAPIFIIMGRKPIRDVIYQTPSLRSAETKCRIYTECPQELLEKVLTYVSSMEDLSRTIAVDVACGKGHTTRLLAANFQTVIGVDEREALLAEAKQATKAANVEYRLASMESLPVTSSTVDVVTCLASPAYMNIHVFHEVERLLKPGGQLVGVAYQTIKINHDSTNAQRNLDGINEDLQSKLFARKEEFFQLCTELGFQAEYMKGVVDVQQLMTVNEFLAFLTSIASCMDSAKDIFAEQYCQKFVEFLQSSGDTTSLSEIKLSVTYSAVNLVARKQGEGSGDMAPKWKLFEGTSHAKIYQKYRQTYPAEAVNKIMDFLSKKHSGPFDLAVDVGCGTGQSTMLFAPYFKNVIGVDVSPGQVQIAKESTALQNIQFRISPAESLPFLETSSVDLLTCFECVHWFDYDRFCIEVDRVLKPNAVFAMCGYRHLLPEHDDKEIQSKLQSIYFEVNNDWLAPYWSGQRKLVDTLWIDFSPPFADSVRDTSLEVRMRSSADLLIGLISTFSAYQTCARQNPDHQKQLDGFYQRFLDVLRTVPGVKDPREVTFDIVSPLAVIMGRKPSLPDQLTKQEQKV